MMKLEGKRPMCWNFVSERLSRPVSTTRHEAFETHRKPTSSPGSLGWAIQDGSDSLKKKTRRSIQRTAKSCGAHVFDVHSTRIYSCRGSEK